MCSTRTGAAIPATPVGRSARDSRGRGNRQAFGAAACPVRAGHVGVSATATLPRSRADPAAPAFSPKPDRAPHPRRAGRISGERWSAGRRATSWGSRVHFARREGAGARPSLRDVATPYLEDLYEATHENVNLGVLHGTDVLFLARVTGHRSSEVLLRVGDTLPAPARRPARCCSTFAPRECGGAGARPRTHPTDPAHRRDAGHVPQAAAHHRRAGLLRQRRGDPPRASCPASGGARARARTVRRSRPCR